MMLSFIRQVAKASLWPILLIAIIWTCPAECGGATNCVTTCQSTQGVWDVVLNGHVVLRMRCSNGGFSPEERAGYVADRLNEALLEASAEDIKPAVVRGSFAVVIGQKHVVTIDAENAKANNSPCYELALKWANNMRLALGGSPLSSCDSGHLVSLEAVHPYGVSVARASWYGGRWNGRLTANGEIYDEMSLTAAHRTLPFGSIVRVTNLLSGEQVVVRINNRGPYIAGREIDLSRAAAEAIGLIRPGVVGVAIEVISSCR
jgi:rare lipoprotein A